MDLLIKVDGLQVLVEGSLEAGGDEVVFRELVETFLIELPLEKFLAGRSDDGDDEWYGNSTIPE